jgi:replicative DNA helicase
VIEHENAILVRMVVMGSVRKYDHLLRPDYFNGFNVDIYEALRTYEAQYGRCMDEATFRHQFPEFNWDDTGVQVEWYADELAQDYVKAKVQKLLNETVESLDENPKAVTKDLQAKLVELSPFMGDALSGRVGLVDQSTERLKFLQQRRTDDDKLSGITTGLPVLDTLTNGTQPGEIEFYVARPGNGKSLMLLYSCYRAWTEQGKRISFISPEMSHSEMGLRFDSMHTHMSSMRMQSGRMQDHELEAYSDAMEELRTIMPHDIMFHDSLGLGRKFTTGDVRRIIEDDKPDILALDGILLIEPIGKYRDTRGRVTNICEELKAIVVQTGVPMRLAHQANREAEQRVSRSTTKKTQQRSPLDGIPHLHELAESGSTEQYANRVICMRLDGGRLWTAIRKNRNGPENKYVSVRVDIDNGVFADDILEDIDSPTDVHAKSEPQQESFIGDDDEFDKVF